MTVWAYKDGILASDSRVLVDRVICGSMKKVTKAQDGWLAAGAGAAGDVTQFLKWVEESRDEDAAVKLENLEGVMISSEGEVFLVESDLHPFQVFSDFHAGGTGAPMALGAMEMGASAEEAVKVTIKHNAGCGGEVQVVKL